MAFPKGKTYFGEAIIYFNLTRNLTESDPILFLDYVGTGIANLTIND